MPVWVCPPGRSWRTYLEREEETVRASGLLTIAIHQRLPEENLQAMDESVKDAGLKYRETFPLAARPCQGRFRRSYPKDLAPDWSGQHIWSLRSALIMMIQHLVVGG